MDRQRVKAGRAGRAARARGATPPLSRVMLERLARYHQITSRASEEGRDCVSSAMLAAILGVDATLVRKDMAAAGIPGRPRVGYAGGAILARLDEVLGLAQRTAAILVGCGGLGGALANYVGFARYGLQFVALFDIDPARIGQLVGGLPVQPLARCAAALAGGGVELAVLAVPAPAAQDAVEALVALGVRAIWNFTPVDLHVPADVVVRDENLGLGLTQLLHQLSARRRRERRSAGH